MKINQKKKLHTQRGAISVFVMYAMLFFLATIIGIYMIGAKRAQTQSQSIEISKDQYYTEGEEETKYNEKIADVAAVIPIYTKEQLWSIGTGKKVEIDGKVYDFTSVDQNSYQLMNDIYIDIENDKLTDTKITSSNGYNVYYYKGGECYTKSASTADLSYGGYNFKRASFSDKLGYVTDGLMLHYDGIKNTATGHSNDTTTWIDLSGNGNNGTLTGCTWEDTDLSFDGADDGIYLGDMLSSLFLTNNTIEITLLFNESDARDILIGNYSQNNNINYEKGSSTDLSGRVRVYLNNGKMDQLSTDNIFFINEFQAMSYIYDKSNSQIKLKQNSNDVYSFSNSEISSYSYQWNAVWIGRDSRTGETCLNGKICSVRVYNRALTDEEIKQNYEIDKSRFGI